MLAELTLVIHYLYLATYWASQVALVVKNPPASAGDTRDVGLIPGSGRSTGVGNSTPVQHSCLANFTDRGVWQAAVHGVENDLDMTEQSIWRHFPVVMARF